MRYVRWITAVLVVASTAAACSSFPSASLTPHELAIRQLAANQAIWESKSIRDYSITIERQCFCVGGQLVFEVVGGVVTHVTNDQDQPLRPDEVPDQPKTVPELFALVAALPAETALTVSYDAQFGFPTFISVDPIPNAVDDEYTIVVHQFKPAQPAS